MFFQPPEPEPTLPSNSNKSAGSLKSARRKYKKRAQKHKLKKQALRKEKQRFANTMSSWAESFTMAATWQLKHQVAHWKSKARALEYENNILRDMLRQYYVKGGPESKPVIKPEATRVPSDTEDSEDSVEDEDEENEDEESRGEDDENMEISEEFIQFLKGNAEFRKMRIERERIRQLEEEMPMRKLEACPDDPIDINEEYQRLYGTSWQRIAALEMSMQSKYMADCDKDKPLLWPNIPIRL